MKPKANLLLVLSLVALAVGARGQVASNPSVPSVPRADGAGPSAPSMSPAVGDIATPAPAPPKAHPGETPLTAAELDAAAKTTEKSGPGVFPHASPGLTAGSAGKIGPSMPANKGWALEGSPTVSSTGPASPVSEVLDTTTLAARIRDLPLANRTEFLNDLEARLDGTDRDLNEVHQTSRLLKGDARAAYLAADNDVKARHRTLKRGLKEARAATPEGWTKSRSALATDYEAYAIALARVEASSSVGR